MSLLPQCRQVKITILGEEGVPVQVDGEAWIQPPGIVKIVHKNRAQMLTRDRVTPPVSIVSYCAAYRASIKVPARVFKRVKD